MLYQPVQTSRRLPIKFTNGTNANLKLHAEVFNFAPRGRSNFPCRVAPAYSTRHRCHLLHANPFEPESKIKTSLVKRELERVSTYYFMPEFKNNKFRCLYLSEIKILTRLLAYFKQDYLYFFVVTFVKRNPRVPENVKNNKFVNNSAGPAK